MFKYCLHIRFIIIILNWSKKANKHLLIMTFSDDTQYNVKRNDESVGTYKGAIKLFAVLAYLKDIGYDSMEDFRADYPNDEFECVKA